MNVIVVPIAAVVSTVPLLVAGVPFEIAVLLPVPIMALFFGWLPHNDLAYDSTALWMHIASGMRGAPDRIGRLVPVLLIGIRCWRSASLSRSSPTAGGRSCPP